MAAPTLAAVRRRLRECANPKDAEFLQRFFKTGPGQYGEGDKFLGIRVPASRRLAREFRDLPLAGIEGLLGDAWHEARLLALILLVDAYDRGTEREREVIYRFYLKNARRVNNWDLVDLSAPNIVGKHLLTRPRSKLDALATSKNLWERRIAIVATASLIRAGEFDHTIRICETLMNDQHDLIHKACGWMLREVGDRDRPRLEAFLETHAATMPRTMLRYAIEKFPSSDRARFMAAKRSSSAVRRFSNRRSSTTTHVGDMRPLRLLLALSALMLPLAARGQRGRGANPAAVDAVKAKYEKLEVRIPMRDGAKLFTVVYVPRDTSRTYPFLMTRTPYGVGAPDGSYRPSLGLGQKYMDAGFIFVSQDARGRLYSEGNFTEMTPHQDHKAAKDVDESTDSYDTIDWLVKNIPHNNGRVGIYGTSYPGFYTTASCIDPHPALKACRPGSPMTDLWNGDDEYHNGAFYLGANMSFYEGFGRTPRNPNLGPDPRYDSLRAPRENDAYQFFLGMGPVGPGSRKYLAPGTAPLWDLVLQHPAYDAFWQVRDIRRHLAHTAPAMLETGGFYDAEDLFGPFGTFRAIEQGPSRAGNHLAIGPWSHGGWANGDGDRLSTLRWTAKSALWFRDSVEFPFFMHHLAGGPDPKLPKVLIFRTGADRWDRYDEFPPKTAKHAALYLQPGGKLAFDPPTRGAGVAFAEYVSDPANPVPVVGYPSPSGMPREYMVGDNRFASQRSDVVTFATDPLTDDVTIVGPVSPMLHVATSGTDADFDVKLIDVWPDDAPNWPGDTTGFRVAGYQQLVRGEPFRGRYRRSRETPAAFVPNRPDSLTFETPDINHTFRKGHRIMVQVQSSWFPLTDRNPQTFVPNIFEAKAEDFVKATMRVYFEPARASRIEVLRLP